jgi:hypothetical protein
MALRLVLMLAAGLLTGDITFPAAPGGAAVRVEFAGRWVGHTGTEKEPIDITLSDGTMVVRTRAEQASFPCTLTTDAEGRVFFRGPFNCSAEGTYRVEPSGAVRLSFPRDARRGPGLFRSDSPQEVWVLRPGR